MSQDSGSTDRKHGQNIEHIIQLMKTPKITRINRLQSFLQNIINFEATPVLTCILKKYSLLKWERFGLMMKPQQIIKHIKQRRNQRVSSTINRSRQWQMPDFLSLIWISSKLLQLSRLNYRPTFQFQKEHYEEMDQIMSCPKGECQHFLKIMMANPYTDKWSRDQSSLLSQIIKKQSYSETIDWQIVSQKFKQSDPEPTKIYRCPFQCEMKWRISQFQSRQWTQQQDNRLLKIMEDYQQTRKNWNFFQKFFEARSGTAIKLRFQHLVDELKMVNPYPNKLTRRQLIHQKNRGRIDISASQCPHNSVRKAQNLAQSKRLNQVKVTDNNYDGQEIAPIENDKHTIDEHWNWVMDNSKLSLDQQLSRIQNRKEFHRLVLEFEQQINQINLVIIVLKQKFNEQYLHTIRARRFQDQQQNNAKFVQIKDENYISDQQNSDYASQNSLQSDIVQFQNMN